MAPPFTFTQMLIIFVIMENYLHLYFWIMGFLIGIQVGMLIIRAIRKK